MLRIIDYGSGNLRSVQKAFEKHGVTAEITSDPNCVAESDRLVLPGVGAFSDAMAALRERGLVEPIRGHINADRPFLGICMGLQLLFETGWEGGRHDGLGVFAGDVARFNCSDDLKVPHMGWNTLTFNKNDEIIKNIAENDYVYFVHSYYAKMNQEDVVAYTEYGVQIPAIVRNKNIIGMQFHPEKSGTVGLNLLSALKELVV